MPEPTPHLHVLPSSLEEAERVAQRLAQEWPTEFQEINHARPLWQDAINTLSPEWAAMCGLAIGWLDQLPAVLVVASGGSKSAETVSAYRSVGTRLETLLKEVEQPGVSISTWGRLLGKSSASALSTPLTRLETILAEKKALDEASQARIRSIRQGLSLGEQTRQLAAIVVDALPKLQDELKTKGVMVNQEPEDSLLQSQRKAQILKALDRAKTSLHLVSERLTQEFSTVSAINQDQLERAIEQEESLQTRLDALSTKIGHAIAGNAVNAQSQYQLTQMAAIIPAPSLFPTVSAGERPGTQLAAPVQKTRWFASIIPSFDKNGLSRSTVKNLKQLQRTFPHNSDGHPEFLRLVQKIIEDPSVSAITRMPKTNELLLNYILEEDHFRGQSRDEGVDAVLELLVRAIPDILTLETPDLDRVLWKGTTNFSDIADELSNRHKSIQVSDIRWDAVADLALRAVKFKHSQRGFDLLDLATRAVGNQVDDEIPERFLRAAIYHRAAYEEDPWKCFMSANIANRMVSAFHFDKVLSEGTSRSQLSSWKHITEEWSDNLKKVLDVHILMQGLKEGRSPTEDTVKVFASLSDNDVSRICGAFLTHATKSKDQRNWLAPIVNHPLIQSELAKPRSKDNHRAYLLRDIHVLYSTKSDDIPVSSTLLDWAITSRNQNLLSYIETQRPGGVIEGEVDIKRPGIETGLMALMRMNTTVSKGEAPLKINPTYWCKVFKDQLEERFHEEYVDRIKVKIEVAEEINMHTDYDEYWDDDLDLDLDIDDDHLDDAITNNTNTTLMTPLVWACQRGAYNWARALVNAGANTGFQSNNSKMPVDFLRDLQAADVLDKHEDMHVLMNDANKSTQKMFIKGMIKTMNTTGIWDIASSIPNELRDETAPEQSGEFRARLLASAIASDLHPALQHDASNRKDAITRYVQTLNRPQFLEAVSYLLKPDGDFLPNDPNLKDALSYGVKCGLLVEATLESDLSEVLVRAAPRSEEPKIKKRGYAI